MSALSLDIPSPSGPSLRHSSSTSALPDSWGQALKQYEHDRRNAAMNIQSPVRVDKMKTLENYQYNPITNKFNDADKEAAAQQAMERRTKGRGRGTAAGYNIINNGNMSNWEPSPIHFQKKHLASPMHFRRDYNLINLTAANAEAAQRMLQQDKIEQQKKLQLKQLNLARGGVDKVAIERRDYSIINGAYYENNTARAAAEAEENRQQQINKLYSNHAFNPVKQEYYDPSLEDFMRDDDRRRAEALVSASVAKLPERIRHSEGREYNIINPPDDLPQSKRRPATMHVGLRADLNTDLSSPTGAAANMLWSPSTHIFEANNREKRTATQIKELARSFNRVSKDRFKYENARGYNLITNEPMQPIERPKPNFSQNDYRGGLLKL